MKSCDVRDELIRVLRLDLIGPEPESAHEREELFAAEDESGADDADVPERSSARKVFLPSSMGLIVLTPPGTGSLEAEVTWGEYRMPPAGAEGS